jgi:ferredoxin
VAIFTITVEDTGEIFRARDDATLLEAMEGLGRCCIAVGCRFGGCGVCRIEVLEGQWVVGRPMSRDHVSDEDERAGRVLACRIRATSDLRIRRAESGRQRARRADQTGLETTGTTGRGDESWR